ncbi:MAG: hypothetical protein U9O91_03315 [Candidatus Caldatribacteriota bacterium]|nr:hypothetical protein [Candidatus Caldatribacteriota bacterium]
MKREYFFVILFLLVVTVLLVSCGGENKEILKYSVTEKEDTSYLNTPRMVYRIILEVDKLPSDKEMEKTAIDIWKKGNKNWKEFTVFMYLPEMDTKSLAYGIGEFNQNGLTEFKKNEYALIETKWEVTETKTIENKIQSPKAKEYKIELSVINEGERKVKINIDTNFPDGTNLHIWVKRIYYQGGNLSEKYAGEIFAKDVSVKNGKIELLIDIDDSGWYNEYYRKAEEYKDIIDMPGVTHTSKEIEISVLFTPKRDQPKDILEILGYNGEFIKGPGVDESGNFNTYRVSTSLEIPFQK